MANKTMFTYLHDFSRILFCVADNVAVEFEMHCGTRWKLHEYAKSNI